MDCGLIKMRESSPKIYISGTPKLCYLVVLALYILNGLNFTSYPRTVFPLGHFLRTQNSVFFKLGKMNAVLLK